MSNDRDNKINLGRIVDSNNKLLDFDLSGDFDEFNLYKNDIQIKIKKIFEINSIYTFVMTTANTQAEKALTNVSIPRKYAFDSNNEYKGMYLDNSKKNDKYTLSFSPAVMDTYLKTLEDMIVNKIGKDNNISYPLLEMENIHNLDRPHDIIHSPVVHIIKNNPDYVFRNIVDKLNSDEAYTFAKKHELPQCYRMGEIKFLREKGIMPLITLPRTWVVDGSMLKNAVDFLSQFRLRYKSRSSSDSDGDS